LPALDLDAEGHRVGCKTGSSAVAACGATAVPRGDPSGDLPASHTGIASLYRCWYRCGTA
jgi:hypothetical protein